MNANPLPHGNPRCLYLAMELSHSTWKLAFTDQIGRRPRFRNISAGSLEQLQDEITRAKKRFELPEDVPVMSCYEAGRDAFWLHRCLVSMGVENHVVEPASIQVNRRSKRAKTDRIDAEQIVASLIRYLAGDRFACRMVRVPEKDVEDARQLHRELKSLKGERTSHTNRIRGLLVTQGCREVALERNFPQWLKQAAGGDGEPIGARLKARLEREFERLQLVTRQIRKLQMEQHALVRRARRAIAKSTVGAGEYQTAEGRILEIAEHLSLLGGIGVVTAWTLAAEIFAWRDIQNRRQLAALVGLVPTPHASGQEEKEQGISKSGRSELRVLLIEIAWLWLQYQPQSDLADWYQQRFGHGTSRERKRGIVALARKLLVALGKYIRDGEIPAGATLSQKLSCNYTASLDPIEPAVVAA